MVSNPNSNLNDAKDSFLLEVDFSEVFVSVPIIMVDLGLECASRSCVRREISSSSCPEVGR